MVAVIASKYSYSHKNINMLLIYHPVSEYVGNYFFDHVYEYLILIPFLYKIIYICYC